MTSKKKSWNPCPKGELSNLAARLGCKRRMSAMCLAMFYGGSASLVLLFAMVGYTLLGTMGLSELECKTVQTHLVEYRANDLDTRFSNSIEHHLNKCGHCRKKYDAMRDERVSMAWHQR
ncbi:MAG: hypothetical protein COA78_09470 [Blastopirellula sp.]|nr:MAG: hypothetical protein COA78_09470 [Blastopirellula sp.]